MVPVVFLMVTCDFQWDIMCNTGTWILVAHQFAYARVAEEIPQDGIFKLNPHLGQVQVVC